MKASNNAFVERSGVPTFRLFLRTLPFIFFMACNTEGIAPVPISQSNRVESTFDNNIEETERRWWRAPTSIEVFCDWLRARVDRLLDEYKDPSTTTERRDAILTELREIGANWRAGGCQAIYGDITKLFPRQPLNPAEGAPTGGVVLN